MSISSSNSPRTSIESPQEAASGARAAKTRTVQRCNFRLAGRLTNEDARAVTALNEMLAADLASTFDIYFSSTNGVKLDAIKQLTVKEYVAESNPLSFMMPFSSAMAIVEVGLDLAFPMIELLMGGTGDAHSADRVLSEIEEEMMQDIASLIMHRVEEFWAIPDMAMAPDSQIKPSALLQLMRPTEKVTVLRFEVNVGKASGSFSLVLSAQLLDSLVKHLKEGKPEKKSRMFSFPSPPLRERILDCEMEVTTELTGLKVPVRDLVSLELGSVLKLRAPIRMSALVTLGGRGLFEAVPVRSGAQRAAQLGRRMNSTDWKRR